MAVVANRSGSNAVVQITVDIADILALNGASNADKKQRAMQRAHEELMRSIQATQLTDAQLDQQVAEVTAQVSSTKAARSSGSL